MHEITIQARALAKSFTLGTITTPVIERLDIAVRGGELTMVVGPSGSGKSTLLAMLSGLLRPDGGEVRVLGTDLWQLDAERIDAFRLDHCGFVFQGFNLFPALTALEQVLLPLSYAPMSRAREAALAVLAEVGLEDKLHLRPQELSGGEKQRVAIARALAKRPRLLFADEPTSALDGHNGQILAGLLKQIAREHGTTVLCVTHDQRLLEHADRVLHMEDGAIGAELGVAQRATKEGLQ